MAEYNFKNSNYDIILVTSSNYVT